MTFDFDELTWLIGFLFLAVLLAILWRRKHTISYLFCFSLFWVYLLLVLRETLFPIPLSGDMFEVMRKEMPFMAGVNLTPLYFGPLADIRVVGREIVLNIILTIPFGFGIHFIAQYRAKGFLWLAIGAGLGIEGMQLMISLLLGFPYRAIDINDVLLNIIGVFIGYMLFKIFALIYVNVTHQLKIEQRGLLGYIYEVSFNA